MYRNIIKSALKDYKYCKYKDNIYFMQRGLLLKLPITKETNNFFKSNDSRFSKSNTLDLDDPTKYNQWKKGTLNRFVKKGYLPKIQKAEDILEQWSNLT